MKAKWRSGGRRASAHEDENLARWKDLEKIVVREKKRNVRSLGFLSGALKSHLLLNENLRTKSFNLA